MPRINSAIFQKKRCLNLDYFHIRIFFELEFKTILSYGYIIIFQIYSGRSVFSGVASGHASHAEHDQKFFPTINDFGASLP